jgi:hypothetical protein
MSRLTSVTGIPILVDQISGSYTRSCHQAGWLELDLSQVPRTRMPPDFIHSDEPCPEADSVIFKMKHLVATRSHRQPLANYCTSLHMYRCIVFSGTFLRSQFVMQQMMLRRPCLGPGCGGPPIIDCRATQFGYCDGLGEGWELNARAFVGERGVHAFVLLTYVHTLSRIRQCRVGSWDGGQASIG